MVASWNSTGISQRFIGELRKYCSTNAHIDKVLLYGSRARGDFRRTSDIDLAVYTSHTTHSQQNLIEQAIIDMSTPLKIDIVFMDRLTKDKLIENIIKDGMVIYEQGKVVRKA